MVDLDKIDLDYLEMVAEAYGDQYPNLFAREDMGWKPIGEMADAGEIIPRETLVRLARKARIMSVAAPLIRRACSLKIAYVWGQGCTISAAQEQDAQQDVNAVVQAFLDDESNLSSFSSQQAHEDMERILETDGQIFFALPTTRQNGRVQVRRIPFRQVVDVICDPEDAETPWFYKREYETYVIEPSFSGLTTRSRRETRRVLYPDLRFKPSSRPKSIDGIPVEWDTPVYHVRVNRVDGSKWGTPDLLAALPWAEGYEEFLQDWAKLIKALSRFAFRATSRGRNASTVRSRIESADPNAIGSTVVQGPDQKFEAIGKSGATIDSDSGRPLAAMVASAVDVPVTMLLGDPGVTGARATAETLDQPLQLSIKGRQTLFSDLFMTVLTYVINMSIEAPQGLLKGVVKIDPYSGRKTYALANDQPIAIMIDWPSIEKVPLDVLIKAIVEAEGTNLLPPELIARQLLMALDVDDIDEVMSQLTDDNGDFIFPTQATTSTPTDVAGAAAAEAVRRGLDAAEYV